MDATQRETFDVIVVGSGMAGGTAAQQFCAAGLRVLVLEAGGAISKPERMGVSISHPPDQQVQRRCYAFGKDTCEYFVNDSAETYGTPSNKPFSWIRVRAVGGKSLLWAGHCYRMGDLEFKAAETDGIGISWPLTYAELKPYYDKAEHVLQVRNIPALPPSAYHAGGENAGGSLQAHLAAACTAKGCMMHPARVSHNARLQFSENPCMSCGRVAAECVRPVSSRDSTLAAAMQTGRMTLWTEFSVASVTAGSNGKVTGVIGVHHATGEHREIKARLIFLCASALESTRILLNSASPGFPNGLANSSGVLGHYLTDHVSGILTTAICDGGGTPWSENSRAGMFYLPRWQNLTGSSQESFLRGYGVQGFLTRADHELLPCGRTQRIPGTNIDGSQNPKDAVLVRLAGFGEMLPDYDNYVEIDKNGMKDVYGIPALRIHCQHSKNEIAMARDMAATSLELLELARAKIKEVQDAPWEPGLAIHEAGTCRMGADPKTSVLNAFNQCHDIKNLFVTDASSFPSIGTQNPALTIVALTIRACEYAMRELKQAHI